MKWLLLLLLIATPAFSASPTSTNNDDTCDIKIGPAATLLLPYFEVDLSNPAGQTTLFTVTNVTRYPQIAHVTLWTDWAYPVVDFNLFLTGYDVQSINLRDVLVNGVVAPPNGTTSSSTPGTLSASNSANANIVSSTCTNVPGTIPPSITKVIRTALTTGIYNPGPTGHACTTMGGVHANAVGYATIDVVSNCASHMPTDPLYYTTDLLFDNVLIGDYQQVGASPAGTGNSTFGTGGNPMVHIRALPEGGGAGSVATTALPYTFYDLYTPATNRIIDRRQPLPATFAAHYVQGGTSAFYTNLAIWREAYTAPGASCASYVNNAIMVFGEAIRFDEHENSSTMACFGFFSCGGPPTLPATSASNMAGYTFPPVYGVDVAGWIYLNMSNCGSSHYSVTSDVGGAGTRVPTNRPTSLSPPGATTVYGPRPSQNWVTITMFAKMGTNSMSTTLDAAPLGNGCSPAAFLSVVRPIAPAGGVFVCPPGTTLTNGTTTLCTGTNGNPLP